jgi:hypothetical protein
LPSEKEVKNLFSQSMQGPRPFAKNRSKEYNRQILRHNVAYYMTIAREQGNKACAAWLELLVGGFYERR